MQIWGICCSIFCITQLWAIPGFSKFNPPTTGRALYTGGWMLEYPMGEVSASPEFSFPLQLVYLTSRTQQGFFGSQWFCPQLESSVIPAGRGYILWNMPSGEQMAFREDEDRKGEYIAISDKAWRATSSPTKQEINHIDGWVYQFSKGKLISVLSPSRRVMELEWRNNQLNIIRLCDLKSNFRRTIFQALYNDDKRLSSFKLHGQLHQFIYVKDGIQERLSAWSPPIGEDVKFLYSPDSGVLAKVGVGNTTDPSRIEEFKTEFVKPSDSEENASKKLIANYWMIQDTLGVYTYGRKGEGGKDWSSGDVTLKRRSGQTLSSTYVESRGVVTNSQDGKERRDFYYRSPGQKYDGKLRRIEENGKVVLEYRYDRKTGLLIESHDAKGLITFYDYDPKFRPSKLKEWEPKPVRIRSGSRRKWDLIAEYAYSEDGKLIAAKDGHGHLTKYTYTARGEVASVTTPAGDVRSFTYDDFGRCTLVNTSGRTQSLEYNENGKVTAQTGPDGLKTELIYDADGILVQIKRNGKLTKELLLDEFKRVIGEKDALNRSSRIERDARGNLLAQHAPNGSITRYEYDEFDRRKSQIDGNGNKISFRYDPDGRLIEQVNALGNIQRWKYDPKTSQLVERQNGEQVIAHSYGKNRELISLDYGNGQKLDYSYDQKGRPVSITGPDTTFEYAYDEEGRLTATRAVCGEDDQLLAYRYNRRGQRTGMLISQAVRPPSQDSESEKEAAYEALQQTEQSYDDAGNLAAIFSNGVPVIRYSYDLAGRPSQKVYGEAKDGKSALTVDIGYDSMGNLARMEFKGGGLPSPLLLAYEWDEGNQLNRRTWNGQTLRYEYDPSGQLLKVIDDKDQSVLEAYTYDQAGNMLTKLIHGNLTAMTYNKGNQLVKSMDIGTVAPDQVANILKAFAKTNANSKDALSYHYDRAGRMLGTDQKALSRYGWLDKVTEVTLPDVGKANYRYWPDGQLASIGGVANVPVRVEIPKPQVKPVAPAAQGAAIPTPEEDNSGDGNPFGVAIEDNPFGTPIQSNRQTPAPSESKKVAPAPVAQPEPVVTPLEKEQPTATLPPLPEETFLWDGLALIRRNDTIYLIEPHLSGGVPIASHPIGRTDQITYHLNDMLGTTLATLSSDELRFSRLTSFGQSLKAPTTDGAMSPPAPVAPESRMPQPNQLPPTRR